MNFTKTHEWVTLVEDIATIGVTEYAQQEIGEIVYVELPKTKIEIKAGEAVVVLESTKAAIDLYSPLSGTIIEVNEILKESPEKINASAQKEGWLFRLKIKNPSEISNLLDHKEYQNLINP